MRKGKLILAGVFAALSLFFIAFSFELPPSKNGVPGPGTWPILISLVMLFSALALGFKAFNNKDKTQINIAGKDQVRVYISMVSLVAYLICIVFIGFAVSTFIMLYGFITWFGNYKWYFRMTSALVITMVIYCIFHFVLKVPFRFGLLF